MLPKDSQHRKDDAGSRERRGLSSDTSPQSAARAWALQITVFISGAVLMALEIVGSRILAPYFGNSVFVWGSLISIFLTALSIGYWWGGALSARRPRFVTLALLIGIAGAAVVVLPTLYPSVSRAIASSQLGSRLSPLLASSLFFLLPSIFLGTVSPYAVRLSVTALTSVGVTAGNLYAVSTCGSILGTILTAFVLIPILGVEAIVYSLGATLLVLAALIMVGHRRSLQGLLVLGIPALVVTLLGVSPGVSLQRDLPATGKEIFAKDSFYHRIRVIDEGDSRHLFFDRSKQSSIYIKGLKVLHLPYTRAMTIGSLFAPEARRALIVGLGAGSIPQKYRDEVPEMKVEVAEIDPEVVQVAERFFGFRPDGQLKVSAQDGRLYILNSKQGYDLVFLDAYFAESIPFHLTTVEFYRELAGKVSTRGVVVSNIIGALRGERSSMLRSMVKTLKIVFPQVYVFPVSFDISVGGEIEQNVIVVASRDPVRSSKPELIARSHELSRRGGIFYYLSSTSENLLETSLPMDDVPVLTDDYAPVDSLLHY